MWRLLNYIDDTLQAPASQCSISALVDLPEAERFLITDRVSQLFANVMKYRR